jgi:hypothetical protein
MTDQANLERAYWRLLAWYPRAFRREYGPEIVAVLLACARDGQSRPGVAQSADMIRSGLRMHLRPGVPRPARTVRAAIGLMYAGAAVSTLNLINSIYLTSVLASIDDNKIHHMRLPELTGMIQVPRMSPVAITVGIAGNLVLIAPWLWIAQMAGQRRNWARTAATALFGLATLDASLIFVAPSLSILIDSSLVALLTWPIGAAAVCLLWLPASTASLKPPGLAPAQPPGAGQVPPGTSPRSA